LALLVLCRAVPAPLGIVAQVDPTAIPTGAPPSEAPPAEVPATGVPPVLVTPPPPVIVDATCIDGVFTREVVSFPGFEGVEHPEEWAQGRDFDPSTTVTFEAHLITGNAWNLPLPEGWAPIDQGSASYRLEIGPFP
jgi:hypothetical protein